MALTPVGNSCNISLILHCWYVAQLGAVDLLPTTDEFPVNCLLIFSSSKSVHPTHWAADQYNLVISENLSWKAFKKGELKNTKSLLLPDLHTAV